jgi:hypothetical protein
MKPKITSMLQIQSSLFLLDEINLRFRTCKSLKLSFCSIRSFPFKEVFLDRTEQEDVPTLIDRKVQSHPLDGIFCQVTVHVPYMLA